MWRRRLATLDAGGRGIEPPSPERPALGGAAHGWREDTSPLGPWRRPRQGALGDCWVIAPLLSLHEGDPGLVPRLVRAREDGAWTIRLHDRTGGVDVRVDRWMPVDERGAWTFARESGAGPGWAGLVEKAAAQHLAASYPLLARGLGRYGLMLLTGQEVDTHLRLPAARRIDGWLRDGHAVVTSTHPLSPAVPTLAGPAPRNHVMAVVGADPITGHVHLRNPWRPDAVLTVDARTFRRAFCSLDRTREPVITRPASPPRS